MPRDGIRSHPAWRALVLGLFVLLCFLAAGLGALFTRTAVGGWYAGLTKPSWNPPNGVFGPVWTALYAMMAVSGWLVWRKGEAHGRIALGWFAIQLALNVGWSALFFGLHSPGAAFGEILLLWAAIAATLLRFWRISRPAGLLLVPYLLWVGFAATLNLAIWRLNA